MKAAEVTNRMKKQNDRTESEDARKIVSLQAYRDLRARATTENKVDNSRRRPFRISLSFSLLIGFTAAVFGAVHLHGWVYEQSQWLWLGGWAVFLIVAAVIYDWLCIELPYAVFALTVAVFAAAVFTPLAWPYAIVMALVFLMRRFLGPLVI
jgi:uncharacterized membrane protein YcjF (UPF0283 family)